MYKSTYFPVPLSTPGMIINKICQFDIGKMVFL